MLLLRIGVTMALLAFALPASADITDPTTRGEAMILEAIKDGHAAELGALSEDQKTVRFPFLKHVIRRSHERVVIVGANIPDATDSSTNGDFFSASADVEFRKCNFKKGITLRGGSFKNLSFEDSDLPSVVLLWLNVAGGLTFRNVAVQADGIQIANSDIGEWLSIQLRKPEEIRLHNLTGRMLTVDRFGGLDVQESTFATVLLYNDQPGSVDLSQLSAKHLRGEFGGNLAFFNCRHSIIDGLMDLRYQSIGTLDLSFSNIPWFSLSRMAADKGWPGRIIIDSTQLKSLNVLPPRDPGDRAKGIPPTAEDPLEFLKKAEFSAPAFATYGQGLADRGMPEDSYYVAVAMHEKLREHEMTCAPPTTTGGCIRKRSSNLPGVILDWLQQMLLGLGLSYKSPLVCSALIVIIGFFVFWKETDMEPKTNDPPASYSRWWYSLELFLPVVDLGVAKTWRPKKDSTWRSNYARAQELAGWILIPVALAAITGLKK